MPLLGLSRIAAAGTLLAGVVSVGGRNGPAPDACKFVSVAEVTELMGKEVGGGETSVVDNPKSLTSSCTYTVARIPTVIAIVTDYPKPRDAKKEFDRQMGNSTDNQTEPGVGESAFWRSVDALSITAVQGPRLATIAVVGGTPEMHDRLHALMVKALSR